MLTTARLIHPEHAKLLCVGYWLQVLLKITPLLIIRRWQLLFTLHIHFQTKGSGDFAAGEQFNYLKAVIAPVVCAH